VRVHHVASYPKFPKQIYLIINNKNKEQSQKRLTLKNISEEAVLWQSKIGF